MELVLASQSPRRKQILEIMGLKFRVIPSDFDESQIYFNNNPEEYCQNLAFHKANTIALKYKNQIIIGADTIVIFNNDIFPKPKDKKEAFTFLQKLSNNTHQVYTGISLIQKDKVITFSDVTDVTFRNLSEDEIHYYIENYNPLDKAGAYGIQDWSSIFVEKINGCYFNVVGFPITKFYKKLKKFSPKTIENLLVKKIENM